MNVDSITIKSDLLFETLDLLKKKGLTAMRKKLLLSIPLRFFKEGSDLWWERSDSEALEDIKHGRVSKPYDNIEELISDLHKGALKKA